MSRLVVMFGGSGFLGRYIAQQLLAAGARVRFAERDPRRAWFLKPLGNLGQSQFVTADITHAESVRRAVQGADAVINLVGILKGDFDAVHHIGARHVAEAAKAAGVSALVHISAIGADSDSPSSYGQSKALGEKAVHKAFPGATILRPSIIFGREDGFINRFAAMIQGFSCVPVVRADVKFQPVYVGDVALAASRALLNPESYAGKTFELAGPQILSMMDIQKWIADQIGRNSVFIPVPDMAGRLMARLFGWLPGAPITWDQWQMLQQDNVQGARVKGLSVFGVIPTPLANAAPGWLVQYRRHGRFGGAPRSA